MTRITQIWNSCKFHGLKFSFFTLLISAKQVFKVAKIDGILLSNIMKTFSILNLYLFSNNIYVLFIYKNIKNL